MTYAEKIKELREIAQENQSAYKDFFGSIMWSINKGKPLSTNTMENRYHLFNNYQKSFSNYNNLLSRITRDKIPLLSQFEYQN
jgi:hypothetical protein